MSLYKSIRSNGKASYEDFGLYIASRNIAIPTIKEITDTVPFKNGSYNFSKLDGECARNDREISYVFDIAELTIEEMELIKRKFVNWIATIDDTDIYDDYIEGYHFHGDAISPEWSEDASQGSLTVKFRVYPYLISNESKKYSVNLIEGEEHSFVIENNSAHSVTPIIKNDNNLLIEIRNTTYSFPPGITNDEEIQIKPGSNEIKVLGIGNFQLEIFEEVI